MEWSSYQRDIFAAAAHQTDDLVAIARAGSGKTTSLVESLNHLSSNDVLVCAFNKRIQEELAARTSRGLVRTLHAMGLRQYGRSRRTRPQVDGDKMRPIIKKLLGGKKYASLLAPPSNEFVATQRIQRLCSAAKNTLAKTLEDLIALANRYDLVDHKWDVGVLAEISALAINESAAQRDLVDFDDMIWMPVMFAEEMSFEQFDVVLVDEAQDLNAMQIRLVHALTGKRVIGFGDPAQAIYLFRGADEHAFDRLTNTAQTLPLPISYRCGREIIAEAQRVVPDIQPAPHAADGQVHQDIEYPQVLVDARPGDFVLSRTNAPLIGICLDLLERNVGATVAGSEIGRTLQQFIDSSGCRTTAELLRWLSTWLQDERDHCLPEYPDRYERARDKVNCVTLLCRKCSTTQEVRRRISKLFRDDDSLSLVTCSTVHKAKGLERDRVWVLANTFGYPSPQDWQNPREERNLWYVAVTRAKTDLFIVTTPVTTIMG